MKWFFSCLTKKHLPPVVNTIPHYPPIVNVLKPSTSRVNISKTTYNQGCGIELELGVELELAFKKTQELGIELAFEKTHELGIELAFATNSPTETKFPSMSGILIEITATSYHLDNLITHN